MTIQKWGGIASFLSATAFIVAPFIYLVGDLRDAFGRLAYDLADFMYGPVWGAGLVTAVLALRERMNARAPGRMSLALTVSILAAGTMILVACIRSANRHYHIGHPELHLEESTTVLVVWTTIIAGVTGAGFHFLGWVLMLIGSAGWKSNILPRGLCILYLSGGVASLFVYLFPVLEEAAALLGMVWGIWQGILLWRGESVEIVDYHG
jgi:hypothetical protein